MFGVYAYPSGLLELIEVVDTLERALEILADMDCVLDPFVIDLRNGDVRVC